MAVFRQLNQVPLGEVTEWPIVLVSKTSVGASPPRVRIPPSPLDRLPMSHNSIARGRLHFRGPPKFVGGVSGIDITPPKVASN